MEGEEPPIENLAELAARYTASLFERQPAGPYLLAGWSLGGFLAFEMARQMTAAGRPPALVAMIDSNAPGPLPRPSESEIAERFISDMAGIAGQPVPSVEVDLDSLEAEQRLDYVKRLLVDADLIPGDVAADFMANRFAVFRANMVGMYAYQPRPYPGRIALLQADAEESRAAWRRFAQGGCDDVSLPGTHYTIWSPGNLPRLARALEQLIAASLRSDKGYE
jgi:thioesterase domain-containing protein